MQQNQNSSSDYQTWVQFFRNALIPTQFTTVYANIFNENRIRFDMIGDLNRELLQEMGITALGDCLSILKHAKTIHSRLIETAKEELETANDNNLEEKPQSNATKKRCEQAKCLIDNYKNKNEGQKDLNEPKPITRPTLSSTISVNNGSSLSADLKSRLHFNTSNSSSSIVQPVVKFNEDSLRSKVVVSSTTIDDDDDLLRVEKSNLKRKLTSFNDEDQPDFRNSFKKRTSASSLMLATNNSSPKIDPSIKSRLSLNLNSIANSRSLNESKTISLNNNTNNGAKMNIATSNITSSKTINTKVPIDSLYSSRVDEKTSVFDRIKINSKNDSLTSRLSPTKKPKNLVGEVNKAKIVKSLGGTGKRVENVAKSRVIPVSVTLSSRLCSDNSRKPTLKQSLIDRLSFNK